MSESTLTLTGADIKRHIGRFLGINRDLTKWTTENTTDVTDLIKSGERQLYGAHNWSFLTVVSAITTGNGTSTYDLPDDFSGFLDRELSISSTKSWAVKIKPVEMVLEQIETYGTSMPTGITQPLMAAVKPKVSFAPATGQRWQIQFWPTPTATLSVVGRYRSIPNTIDDDSHYPMGGQPFAQLLLESCLAAAEEQMNDEDGVHRARFNELLAAAIASDLRVNQQEAA